VGLRGIKKGKYIPKNPTKYVGKHEPIYRSSWEWTFMMLCDNNNHILRWASEPLEIPYINPLTQKKTVYVPDFLIEYLDKNNKKHIELIEIKPKKEAYMESARTERDKARLYVNTAKWKAAAIYSEDRGIKFRVLTEDQIFSSAKP
jgi:hypothetical protein